MVISHKMSLVMRKPAFCICENKDADQLRGKAKLISAFVFAIRIVHSLYYLNPKFQASSHLLWLYSPVCVGPGLKPRRPVFSQRGSNVSNSLKARLINSTWNDHFCKICVSCTITKTCPCNIQWFVTAVKTIVFRWKMVRFFIFLLKT